MSSVDYYDWDYDNDMIVAFDAEVELASVDHDSIDTRVSSNSGKPTKIRKDFPETWIWSDVSVGYRIL